MLSVVRTLVRVLMALPAIILTISYSGPGQQHAALDSVEAGEGEELEEDRRALLSLEQNIGRTPEMNYSSINSSCLVYHGA